MYPAPWQLVYLFDVGAKSWLVHFGVVTFAFYALGTQTTQTYIWLGCMLFLSASLLLLCRKGARIEIDNTALLSIFGWFHTGLTIAVGIGWGAGAFIAAQTSFEELMVFSLALGGTALGAISSQSSVMRSCMASLWTSLPLLALAHYTFGVNGSGIPNAALMLLYGLIMSILAYRINGFLSANQSLTADLDLQVAALKDSNQQLAVERERADSANTSKSRFLAHASHDLRQPLHAIGMLTSGLHHENLPKSARESVWKIEQSVTAMSELFRSLLNFSTLELGQITLSPSPIELNALLHQIVELNMSAADRAACDLIVSPTTHWVIADPALLTNMVQNLVSNAIKYSPGERILVGTKMRGDTISVFVIDQGPGIDQAEQDLVFQEFYRPAHQHETHQDGMGLGLSLVARFAKLMDLNCQLQSVKGHGTSVEISGLRLTIPQVLQQGPSTLPPHRLSGLRVHVVDDDAATLAATVSTLERWGCQASSSLTIPETVLEIDFLISDYELASGVTAVDCIEQMRGNAAVPLPALIVSGRVDLQLGEMEVAEPVAFLAKPAHPAQLRALMLSLLIRSDEINTAVA
ncbi:MAG: hybrid sensor histidine kinase/response regulator [Parvibaculaceae bacterium]|nr:hybrid sensor histidine kinase/response regulator [Parvibaculaceae bacterium]